MNVRVMRPGVFLCAEIVASFRGSISFLTILFVQKDSPSTGSGLRRPVRSDDALLRRGYRTVRFERIRNTANTRFGERYMLELMQVENADIGVIMSNEYPKLAYVLEHHAQSINEVQTGRLKGYWKTYYYENGARKQKVVKDKKDLVNWLYDYIREGEGFNKTFEVVYNEMIQERLDMGVIGHKTALDYQGSYKRFMSGIAGTKISTFTPQMVMKWITKDVLPSEPNQTAFEHMICYLGFAFEYAKRMDYIETDPMEKINARLYYKKCSRSRKKPEDKWFTEEEVELLCEEAMKDSDRPTALLLLFNAEVGTRAGEPEALRKEDIGPDTIYIHAQQIRNDHVKPHTFERVDYTKDTRCKADGQPREFPITPRIRKILDLAAQLPGESEYVFHDENGDMIKKDSYAQYLRRKCERLGIRTSDGKGYKTNNHCFRRCVNLMLIKLGYDASARAKLLGQTTHTNELDYSPTRIEGLQEAGRRMADFRSGRGDDRSLTFTQQKAAV